MHIPYHQLPPLPPVTKPNPQTAGKTEDKGHSFNEFLKTAQASDTLKLSKHAAQRMDERGISFSEQEWDRVSSKVKEAKAKGIHQPLILTDEAALVVSSKHDTVVTALSGSEAEDRIFSNIDGTIIMK